MHKQGLTLLEILVAVIILALVTTGLANIFVTGKRYILHSRAMMTGGELGKLFLNPLQMQVRQVPTNDTTQDGWDQANNGLTVGTTYFNSVTGDTQNPICPSAANRTANDIEYAARFNVIVHPQSANIRKVIANITWDEIRPE